MSSLFYLWQSWNASNITFHSYGVIKTSFVPKTVIMVLKKAGDMQAAPHLQSPLFANLVNPADRSIMGQSWSRLASCACLLGPPPLSVGTGRGFLPASAEGCKTAPPIAARGAAAASPPAANMGIQRTLYNPGTNIDTSQSIP